MDQTIAPRKKQLSFSGTSMFQECDNMGVGEIWKFMSGSSRIPATGFDTTPKVRFNDKDCLPPVSTCDKLKSKLDFWILKYIVL